MSPSAVQDDGPPPGVCVVDDLLESAAYEALVAEARALLPQLASEVSPEGQIRYRRLYLDTHYLGKRSQSPILEAMQAALFGPDLNRRYERLGGLAFALVPLADFHETQLTVYGDGDQYVWHRDHVTTDDGQDRWTGRVANFIYHLAPEPDFDGGELSVGLPGHGEAPDRVFQVAYRPNRLVLVAAHLWHGVERVHAANPDPMRWRLTVNGHIGFARPSP